MPDESEYGPTKLPCGHWSFWLSDGECEQCHPAAWGCAKKKKKKPMPESALPNQERQENHAVPEGETTMRAQSNTITAIETNLKSKDGEPYTVQLGARTLLVGPNEGGKTAIGQACQLAIGGVASGLPFRKGEVRAVEHLQALRPETAKTLWAKAFLSNGDVAEWACEPGHKPKHNAPGGDLVLPIEAIREAFSGTPDTARKFLTSMLVPELLENIVSACPDSSQALLASYLGERTSLTGAEFVTVLEAVAKAKREASMAAKAEIGGSVREVPEEEIQAAFVLLDEANFAACARATIQRAKESGDPADKESAKVLVAAMGGVDVLREAPAVHDAEATVIDLIRTKAAYEVAVVANAARDAMMSQLVGLSALLDFLLEVLEAAGDAAIGALTERTQAFLPETDRFKFDAKIVRPGLFRNGCLHTALSGSTEARVLAAMAAGLCAPGRLSLLVMDDRMWDGKNLAATLRALDAAPCQIIVTSTIRPRGRLRSSWTVIEVGGGEVSDTDATDAGNESVITL